MRAHFTNNDKVIPTSVICTRCEVNTAYRMQSWMNAKDDDEDYDGMSRRQVDPTLDVRCCFCGRKR